MENASFLITKLSNYSYLFTNCMEIIAIFFIVIMAMLAVSNIILEPKDFEE